MGEQLTALDATFLELEETDQSAHMHIGGVMVLEPQPDGVPPLDSDPPRRDRPPSRPPPLHPASLAAPDRRSALAHLGGGHRLPGGASRLRGWAARSGWARRAHGMGGRVLLAAARSNQAALGDRSPGTRRRSLGPGHQDPPLHDRRGRLGRPGDDPAGHRAREARTGGHRRVERRVRLGSSAEIETVTEPEPTCLQRGVARLARPALRLGHAAVMRASPACTRPRRRSASLPTPPAPGTPSGTRRRSRS